MLSRKYSKVLRSAVIVFAVLCICVLFILCVIYRDKITADQIAEITPKNQIAAVFFMLLIFAVKSFCIFIYCGILYAASGMIFPIAIAIPVNILGTVVMTSIPYFIGKKAGKGYIEKLLEKHPKMSILKDFDNNGFFLSFMIRITGLLPSDLVSAFFGASDISYGKYILSTILGFIPMIIAFTVMGMSIHDVTSPTFIVAACAQIGFMIMSFAFYKYFQKRKAKQNEYNKQGD